MDFSLRKSFKNHGRRASAGGTADSSHEELPILSHHHTMSPVDSPDRREVIVKVDGEGTSNPNSRDTRHVMHVGEPESRLWRDSSYDFWRDADDGDGEFRFRQDGLPPKLIGQFLNNRGGDMEMDLEMNEIRDAGLTPIADLPVTYRTPAANSKDLKVSFQAPTTKEIVEDKPSSSSSSSSHEGSAAQGYRNTMQNGSCGNAEVLTCTSNASFQKRPNHYS